jgi:hypothetical protein
LMEDMPNPYVGTLGQTFTDYSGTSHPSMSMLDAALEYLSHEMGNQDDSEVASSHSDSEDLDISDSDDGTEPTAETALASTNAFLEAGITSQMWNNDSFSPVMMGTLANNPSSWPIAEYVYDNGLQVTEEGWNLDFGNFMAKWQSNWKNPSYKLPEIDNQARWVSNWDRPAVIYAEDLKGDDFDIQGIDWTELGITREVGRRVRNAYYSNFRSVRTSHLVIL